MLKTLAVGALLTAAIGVPLAGPTLAVAYATPAGQIQEDDPRWDCRTMGDLQCGPTNAQGVPAGRYEAGVLVVAWEDYR